VFFLVVHCLHHYLQNGAGKVGYFEKFTCPRANNGEIRAEKVCTSKSDCTIIALNGVKYW